MKLKDLSSVLFSVHGDFTFAIVYDMNTHTDVENGCSVEYAITHYGDRDLYRICADGSKVVLEVK